MSTYVSASIHVDKDDIIEAGHRPGIIQIGTATLFFREALSDPGPLTAMKGLRDLLDSQIEDIESLRGNPVAAPADPEPLDAYMRSSAPVEAAPHPSDCLCMSCVMPVEHRVQVPIDDGTPF